MNNIHLVRLGQAVDHEQQGYVPLAKGAARMLSSDGGYIINSRINRNLIKVAQLDAGHRDDLTQAKIKIAEQN